MGEVGALLASGVDVNERTNAGDYPLHLVAMYNTPEVIQRAQCRSDLILLLSMSLSLCSLYKPINPSQVLIIAGDCSTPASLQ